VFHSRAHLDGTCIRLIGALLDLCQAKLRYDPYVNTTNSLENFSATLLSIATEIIPKTLKQHHQQLVPWFSDLQVGGG
jgi:hypothetical protein